MKATVSSVHHLSHDCQQAGIGDLTSLGPLQRGAQVLVVGDGNFSYSRALLRAQSTRAGASEIIVTATSLDTKHQLLEMYPNSRRILAELRDGGVQVRHGVDATKLPSYFIQNSADPVKFDRIVFNFPHYAGQGRVGDKTIRNKIHRHRQLLVDFFASASQLLARDGQLWVTLCAGQGGTKLERSPRAAGDTWRIVHCAAAAKLVLQDAHFCPVDVLTDLGYYSVGYQAREKAFWTNDSITHVFCHEGSGRKACFPIEWTRDVSFWITDEPTFSEALLQDIVQDHFAPETMTVAMSLQDEYRCKQSRQKAVTYRLAISSSALALTRDHVNVLTEKALTAIESSCFGASRRTTLL
uniref:FDX-ACB domain-containing protein n=1 Tax=Hyaloperonospora arabidopsidis (strain Emoy2) TaxID=559515 RepID=M4B1H7_HYAAE